MKNIYDIKLAHANAFVYDRSKDGYVMPEEALSITRKCYYDNDKNIAYDLEDQNSVYSIMAFNEDGVAHLYDYWTVNRQNLIGYELNEINLDDLTDSQLVELKNSISSIKKKIFKTKIKKLIRI